MSTLEALLAQYLMQDQTLAQLLTTHAGQPAVFEFMAPPDADSDWDGAQTPRIEYAVLRQEDPERRVSGTVTLSILHRDEVLDVVAQVEARVRALLDGATFRPDEGTVTLRWARADLFDQEPDYRGIEVQYDLIAWPTGLTYDPDPVQALRDWTVARWPGLQVDPQVWLPTDQSPALYWRLAAVEDAQATPWGVWLQGRFQGHILAQSPSVRFEWMRRVVEGLAAARRVRLSDGSDLMVQSVSADSAQDPLRTGQVRLTARFGVMLSGSTDPPVGRAVIGGAATGEVT